MHSRKEGRTKGEAWPGNRYRQENIFIDMAVKTIKLTPNIENIQLQPF